jgi:aldehyde:ferredoxin oxidoreductase
MDLYSKLLYSATGIEKFKNSKYLWLVGERIFNLERAYNIRQDSNASKDTVPDRILKEPVPREPSKGHVFELDTLLQAYYKLRGWNKQGIPTKKSLRCWDSQR